MFRFIDEKDPRRAAPSGAHGGKHMDELHYSDRIGYNDMARQLEIMLEPAAKETPPYAWQTVAKIEDTLQTTGIDDIEARLADKGDTRLDDWTKEVKAGIAPQFGANLVY